MRGVCDVDEISESPQSRRAWSAHDDGVPAGRHDTRPATSSLPTAIIGRVDAARDVHTTDCLVTVLRFFPALHSHYDYSLVLK